MRDELANTKGFTLIEMLLVITIIGLVSVSAAAGYLSYRKATLLDFAADNIVAQFYQMRSYTLYGEGNGDRFEAIKEELAAVDSNGDPDLSAVTDPGTADDDSKCYGFYFPVAGGAGGGSAGITAINKFEVDFSADKVWKDEAWRYGGCKNEEFDSNNADHFEKLEYDPAVQVVSFVKDDGSGNIVPISTDFIMQFYQPDGGLQYDNDLGADGVNEPVKDEIFKLTIQYGDKPSSRFKRVIEFDLYNQTAVVKKA